MPQKVPRTRKALWPDILRKVQKTSRSPNPVRDFQTSSSAHSLAQALQEDRISVAKIANDGRLPPLQPRPQPLCTRLKFPPEPRHFDIVRPLRSDQPLWKHDLRTLHQSCQEPFRLVVVQVRWPVPNSHAREPDFEGPCLYLVLRPKRYRLQILVRDFPQHK